MQLNICLHNKRIVARDKKFSRRRTLYCCAKCGKYNCHDRFYNVWSGWMCTKPLPITEWERLNED